MNRTIPAHRLKFLSHQRFVVSLFTMFGNDSGNT
jgi:hypothetical protein